MPAEPPGGKLLPTKDAAILAVVLALDLILQGWTLGKLVVVDSDEGVYLYAAKLVGEGAVPYRDFFLAQPPLLIYLASGLLSIARDNVDVVRFCLTVWIFSALVPIYAIVRHRTGSVLAALTSTLLFSTFATLVQSDAHGFTLRPASLPLLAFTLFFLYVRPRPKTAGALLGLFALCLISNAVVGLALAGVVVASRGKSRLRSSENVSFIAVFAAVTLLGYGATMLIPQAFEDLIAFELARPSVPFETRIALLRAMLDQNWPIFLFGLLGSLLWDEVLGAFGAFNLGALTISLFAGRSFFSHYLSILGVGLAVSAGLLTRRLGPTRQARALIIVIVAANVYFAAFDDLKRLLVDTTTPDFYATVGVLARSPGPLFTFEPIYGLYARKPLTFHYHVADMRYFRVLGTNLEDRTYLELLGRSGTVLVEPFAFALLPPVAERFLTKNFVVVYRDAGHVVYVSATR